MLPLLGSVLIGGNENIVLLRMISLFHQRVDVGGLLQLLPNNIPLKFSAENHESD